ncbi:MAG: metal-binding protein [Pseudomonadales bacterium GWC1_66_9]|nr:MAG: metal-binding protein [Pseudomonadales bacterium GWC1_66_9]
MRRLVLLALTLASAVQAAEPVAIDVYRDPSCGCCQDWIRHLEANGFAVTDHVETNMGAVKSRLGVPYSLGSCHTAVIDGKFVEGHVPAADILRLRRQPDLIGAAVPGMPVGSPGMEIGDRQDAYQVIGVTRGGERRVLADYPAR